ncbi:hypothetical protein CH1034_250122 [Klebsiella pneumoniae]|nr:hypothetical protein CH1034_250122 [Klebsiella pneumoniae]
MAQGLGPFIELLIFFIDYSSDPNKNNRNGYNHIHNSYWLFSPHR